MKPIFGRKPRQHTIGNEGTELWLNKADELDYTNVVLNSRDNQGLFQVFSLVKNNIRYDLYVKICEIDELPTLKLKKISLDTCIENGYNYELVVHQSIIRS